MDKIENIRSFVEVASCGSFTRAAQRLDLPKVKLTRQIQELESWLKLRLFNRTTRKVSLTSPGEALLADCERILAQVSALQLKAQSHQTELSGHIRIATPIGLGQSMLFELIQGFVRIHPKVKVHLQLSDKNAQLVDENIDIALRYSEQLDDNLIAKRLIKVDSQICASPDYISRFGQPDVPEQLLQHNCLIHLEHKVWRFTQGKEINQVQVDGNLSANDVGVLLKACISGQGIANLPLDLAAEAISRGELVPLLTEFYYSRASLWAVYLSRSYQRPLVRTFIDYAASQWQQDIVSEYAK